MTQLTSKQQTELVDALLECAAVSDRAARDALVNGLPETIRSRIVRSDIDRDDVHNIVRRCLNYTNGLEELVARVRWAEAESYAMQELDDLILHLFGFAAGEPDRQRELLRLSGRVGISTSDLHELYRDILPPGIAPQSEPLGLFAILAHLWLLSQRRELLRTDRTFPIVDFVEGLARQSRGRLVTELRSWNSRIALVLAPDTQQPGSDEPARQGADSDWQLSILEAILVNLYPNLEQSGLIVARAMLNPVRIEFLEQPSRNWRNILREARAQAKLPSLIAQALADYPENEWLQLAQKGLAVQAAWISPAHVQGLERIVHPPPSAVSQVPVEFLELALQRAQAVALIQLADGARGTGFLLENNLLVTAHYVLPTHEVAALAIVRFNYQRTVDTLYAEPDEYRLAPEDGFATADCEHGDCWTAVRIQGDANARWGAIRLARLYPQPGDGIAAIAHPQGDPKQFFLGAKVHWISDKVIQYRGLPRSGGSPIFNLNWEVVALHTRVRMGAAPDGAPEERAEGVHVNALIDGLVAAGLYDNPPAAVELE